MIDHLRWLAGAVRPGRTAVSGGAVFHDPPHQDLMSGEARLLLVEKIVGEQLSEEARRLCRFPWEHDMED